MNRNKLIALIVGAAVILGAGGALGENKGSTGDKAVEEGREHCESTGGDFSTDVATTEGENGETTGAWVVADCDYGDGDGFTVDLDTGDWHNWGQNQAPPSDTGPSSDAGHLVTRDEDPRSVTEDTKTGAPQSPQHWTTFGSDLREERRARPTRETDGHDEGQEPDADDASEGGDTPDDDTSKTGDDSDDATDTSETDDGSDDDVDNGGSGEGSGSNYGSRPMSPSTDRRAK